MPYQRTIFDEPHYQSLEMLAAQALAENDVASAFAYADRRCRISPPPGAHNYILRGQALLQMRQKAAAVADLQRALFLAPESIAANRRMLDWGGESERNAAARALIRNDRDVQTLRKAILVLRKCGQRHCANAIVDDATIRGWAVWQGKAALQITIESGSGILTKFVDADGFHALAGLGRAAEFRLPRPRSATPQTIVVSIDNEEIFSARVPPNERQTYPSHIDPSGGNPTGRMIENTQRRPVAVLVPIFRDYESVRACLESLLAALPASGKHRIILINDATPEARIEKLLRRAAGDPRVLLLANPRTIGFIGAINRALAATSDEDIILLNADTIVPKNFVARLAQAAARAPDIGTVTPLSNSGEETSFPIPNLTNPLGTIKDIAAIDAAAARVNAGHIVDIPNGTGFCLYVTRACLNAVGPLSEDYERGYFEDVDLCLNARRRGFRNVCDTSVYVGHAGSKSFGPDKRALVVRNRAVLDCRFPAYGAETTAFDSADPLRSARQAVESVLPLSGKRARLLATGSGIMNVVARERARQLAAQGHAAIILEVRAGAGPRASLFNPAGGSPQSLAFALESEQLLDYLRTAQLAAIEIIDSAHVPIMLVDRLLGLGLPHAIFLGDTALLNNGSWSVDGSRPPPMAAPAPRWSQIAETAQEIIVPSEQARFLALNTFAAARLQAAYTPSRQKKAKRLVNKSIKRLGILPVHCDGQEQEFIQAVLLGLRRALPKMSITVIGETLDDLGLMQIGNNFVTGAVEADDFVTSLQCHKVDALLLAATRPIFGHPMLALASSCGRALAYFDWTRGGVKAGRGDLALNPEASFVDVMADLRRWLTKPA